MKKHSGAIAADQVIEIEESKPWAEKKREKEKKRLKSKSAKVGTVLGVVEIICGIVALAIWISVQDNNTNDTKDKGILNCIIFSCTGVLLICVVYIRNECLNTWLFVASWFMSICSAASAGLTLKDSDFFLNVDKFDDMVKVVLVGQMVMAIFTNLLTIYLS